MVISSEISLKQSEATRCQRFQGLLAQTQVWFDKSLLDHLGCDSTRQVKLMIAAMIAANSCYDPEAALPKLSSYHTVNPGMSM